MTLAIEDARIALDGVVLIALSVTVRPGEVVTVMGPSGAGKSSLLAFVSGALDSAFAASGRVLLDGRDVTRLPPERRRVGMLWQDDLLFPHLSVGGNLRFALPRGAQDKAAKIEAALADCGLAGFAGRDPATLSGGQRARAALMRTLLSEPRAVLLDEPFSKLDADLRASFREFVFARIRARGLPTLMVTHDPADAEAAGGRVLGV